MYEQRTPPKVAKVTRKLANEWASMETAHTDRPLSERRLGIYRIIVQRGEFRPVEWAKAWCEETGQFYRVNGKHTSTLFASLPDVEKADLTAILQEYTCPTLEDVAKLYGTFDSRTQLRTSGDVNRSFAAVIPELAEVPARTINLCVGSLAWAENPLNPTGGTAPEKAERLFDHIDYCLWMHSMFSPNEHGGHSEGRSSRHLQRVPVGAAMFACFRKSKAAATDFWTAVRDETGGKPSLPDRKVARFLLTVFTGAASTHAPSRRQVATQRELYVKCLHGWNAWRKGESTDLKYYPDAKLPAVA